ncbi:MAG: class I SAM-dependent methyltransferase [Termitinemataceae bacterium]|nr:MAG: class I SAM-dependent methyltransferase [Termitinemataceae bacterium]
MIKTWSTKCRKEDSRLVPCVLCAGMEFRAHLDCEGFGYKKCTHCGLVQMNPQPVSNQVHERYGKDYLDYELANEKPFLELAVKSLNDAGLERIKKELVQNGLGASVLDIGCAAGALLKHLRSEGWAVQGVEIGHEMAEFGQRERNLEISRKPLEENNFADGSFSLVTASHLIEHLNNPASFVKEVFRILKNGGYFIVITPNIESFQGRIFGSRWRSAIFDHLYLFSRRTLITLLKKEQFTIEKIVTWGGLAKGIAPPFIKTIFDKAAKLLGSGDVMLITAKKR